MNALVVGGGIAGLIGARDLARAGWTVTLVEPRHHVGGRILTRPSLKHGLALDLGPEFIHGNPTEIPELVPPIEIVKLEPATRVFWNGGWREGEEFWDDSEKFLESLRPHVPDAPVSQAYRERGLGGFEGAMVKSFVEGFNAADSDLFSVNALRAESQAAGDDAMESSRITSGYQRLIDEVLASMPGVRVVLGERVSHVTWRPGAVAARVGGETLSADVALFTVPPNLLPDIGFDPVPEAHLRAAGLIAMGDVQKITIVFKQDLWTRPRENFQFLHSPELTFNTRWLWNWAKPFVVTSWAGGARARRLRGLGERAVLAEAMKDLATILSTTPEALTAQIDEVFYHDWMHDPYSRGAYSFVLVGGENARRELAQPLANTLFFAGEATDSDGNPGTVHGAFRSGARAAAEVLATARVSKS